MLYGGLRSIVRCLRLRTTHVKRTKRREKIQSTALIQQVLPGHLCYDRLKVELIFSGVVGFSNKTAYFRIRSYDEFPEFIDDQNGESESKRYAPKHPRNRDCSEDFVQTVPV